MSTVIGSKPGDFETAVPPSSPQSSPGDEHPQPIAPGKKKKSNRLLLAVLAGGLLVSVAATVAVLKSVSTDSSDLTPPSLQTTMNRFNGS